MFALSIVAILYAACCLLIADALWRAPVMDDDE